VGKGENELGFRPVVGVLYHPIHAAGRWIIIRRSDRAAREQVGRGPCFRPGRNIAVDFIRRTGAPRAQSMPWATLGCGLNRFFLLFPFTEYNFADFVQILSNFHTVSSIQNNPTKFCFEN
jgi:hypothetical protein